jgi:hypothetical protein
MPQKLTHPFPAPQGVLLPKLESKLTTEWLREQGDLTPSSSHVIAGRYGIPPESILMAGHCKAVVTGTAKRYGMPESLSNLPHGTVVCSVHDSSGEIVGLHGIDLTWYTSPAIHFSNPKRFRDGVYLVANTFEADAWAFEHNATALGLNACGSDAIAAALGAFGQAVQVLTESWRLAA